MLWPLLLHAAIAAPLYMKSPRATSDAPAALQTNSDYRSELDSGVGEFGEFDDTSTLVMSYNGVQTSLNHSNALFGLPVYGGSVYGRVVFPTGNEQGCGPYTTRLDQWIVMIRRSNCTFDVKAFNAQEAGAAGVIVADDRPMCGRDPECSANTCRFCPYMFASSPCECFLPFLANGGTGNLVNIPTMMIPRADANLYLTLAADPTVMLTATMRWDIPQNGELVEYSVFYNPNDPGSNSVLTALKPFVPYLGPTVKYTPHFFVWSGTRGCPTPNGQCYSLCLPGNWYCSFDPDGDLNAGVSGADVVLEELREICIWQQAASTYATDQGMRFWNYVSAFWLNCANNAQSWNQACSETQMRANGISPTIVQECIALSNRSYSPPDVYVNYLLEDELSLRMDLTIVGLPSFVVNNVVLRGGVSTPTVLLQTICSAYPVSPLPRICTDCLNVGPAQVDSCMNPPPAATAPSVMPGWAIGLLVFFIFVLLIGGAVMWYCYRRQKAEVKEMLDDYRALMESGEAEHKDETSTNEAETKVSLIGRLGLGHVVSFLAAPPPSGGAALAAGGRTAGSVQSDGLPPAAPGAVTGVL